MIKVKFRVKVKSMKKALLDWTQTVNFHNFSRIFKKDNHIFTKITWASIFLALFSATNYILINLIIDYFEYKVVSTIQIKNEVPQLFPMITICDSNPLITKESEQLIRSISNSSYYIDDVMGYVINDQSFSDNNRRRLGFDLESVMTDCSFNFNTCNFTNDFRWIFTYKYGNCFQYNSDFDMNNQPVELKRQNLKGEDYGFYLNIFPLINTNNLSNTKSVGLKVYI